MKLFTLSRLVPIAALGLLLAGCCPETYHRHYEESTSPTSDPGVVDHGGGVPHEGDRRPAGTSEQTHEGDPKIIVN